LNSQEFKSLITKDRLLIRRDREMEKYFRERRVKRFREWGIISQEQGDEFGGDEDAIALVLGDGNMPEEVGVEAAEEECWGK
jgi:fructose-1,6-bisphosphatase/inositol monophosphatase family enzyme